MRPFSSPGAALLTCLFATLAECAGSSSKLVQPSTFTPPQVFKNTNLLRTIDLTKPYVREIIAVIVENVSKEPQTEYYLPFSKEIVPKISYLEARDKKAAGGEFTVNRVEFNDESATQYYRILLSSPLGLGESMTIQIGIATTNVLVPIPAEIAQVDKQFLSWSSSQFARSAYVTEKQKTKLKLPNNEAPDYTKLSPKEDGTSDPVKSGNSFTYGPYGIVRPEQEGGEAVKIRYEYTSPVIKMDKLERDVEVSHWGGNLAIEERYWMSNVGAKLKNQFSRVSWAATSYYNPPTTAIKQLTFPLQVGAKDAYFTDEIGNVSTSRFRSNIREAHLELKPRYPVFGGWNYSFVVGWNHDLKDFLRSKPSGEDFVLKIPFLEGPKEAVTYDNVEITIILPEGATNVTYTPPFPLDSESQYFHKTFMDTLGRTAIKLKASNVVDQQHRTELVVKYHYPKTAAFRKPFVVFTAAMSLFVVSWVVSKIDVKIGG